MSVLQGSCSAIFHAYLCSRNLIPVHSKVLNHWHELYNLIANHHSHVSSIVYHPRNWCHAMCTYHVWISIFSINHQSVCKGRTYCKVIQCNIFLATEACLVWSALLWWGHYCYFGHTKLLKWNDLLVIPRVRWGGNIKLHWVIIWSVSWVGDGVACMGGH